MKTPTLAARTRLTGFSLVEIMVALVIGMIGVLIIMQVASTGEAQKRVTTGSGEAQNNAALGLYTVERDVKQAGYGFSSLNILGRKLTILGLGADRTLNILAPISINNTGMVPVGDTGSDTLLVIYGSSAGSPEGDIIVAEATISGTQHIGVMTATNFIAGEWVVAVPPDANTPCGGSAGTEETPCKMGRVSAIDGGSRVITPLIGALSDWQLFDLGLNPRIIGYAVRGGNLTLCDYLDTNTDCAAAANWTPIANNIVSLRAQYGHEAADKTRTWDDTTPTEAKKWGEVSAVRFALVARNGEYSKEVVTTAAPSWAGSDTAAISIADLGGDGGHYRYQIYETVVPLRNIPWMGL